jgi:hypothetical protein
VPRDVRDPHHIPSSWKEGNSSAQIDAQENLWTSLVNPTCMGCHRANTINFAEFANFLQVGPGDDGGALLRDYVETDPSKGKPPLAVMPQAELLWQNLIADDDALDAIEEWLKNVR